MPKAQGLAGSCEETVCVGIGGMVKRGLYTDDAVVVVAIEKILTAVLNASAHVEEKPNG